MGVKKMKKSVRTIGSVLLWGTALAVSVLLAGSVFAESELPNLETLRPGHPRLIAPETDILRIRQTIEKNETARAMLGRLREDARELASKPLVEYKIIGPRLLTQSRRCLERVYLLALLFRLDGQQEHFDRALSELNAAAAFPDWNPSHFLDTAEMTHAFAIGYDWLYDSLSEEQRTTLRTEIVEKGIEPYLQGFEEDAWWTRATHNWNQVCHGGIGIGALAIADEEPALAATVLQHAVAKLPDALQGYAPDGGWNEGPGYWHYATRYTVYFLAALETALGSDFGLSDAPGFERAGHFRIAFEGPLGQTFNYADARDRVAGTHEMFWLARRFEQPVYAWLQSRNTERPHALDLVWFSPEMRDPLQSGLPLDTFFQGVDTVFLRSAWNDPNAIFVGFKGGDNKANHSHLDLGSFVLDAEGVRWAVDLGPDNYNLPGYFGKKRWTYYRLVTASHNTVLIDGQNQDPRARAPIVAFQSEPNRAFAIADLSQAYALKRFRRGVALLDRERVLVQDEIESDEPVDAVWGMMTSATVKIQGRVAQLEHEGKRLEVRILSPVDAFFEIADANPPEPQRQQNEMKKLTVICPEKVRSVRFAILLTPQGKSKKAQTEIAAEPLEDWER